MKIRLKFLLLFYLALYLPNCTAQNKAELGNFTISENAGEVYLTWSILAGSTCNGISILRSTDGNSFIEIGNIAGVCGNTSSIENYNFTDINPIKNALNYYRLELGFANFSQILAIEIIHIESSGYQIRPNPSSSYSTIYFENFKQLEHEFVLYNLKGIQMSNSLTKEDFMVVNSTMLPNGMYFFTIAIPGNLPKIKGKLLVE